MINPIVYEFPFSPHLNPLPTGERKKQQIELLLPTGEREGRGG